MLGPKRNMAGKIDWPSRLWIPAFEDIHFQDRQIPGSFNIILILWYSALLPVLIYADLDRLGGVHRREFTK